MDKRVTFEEGPEHRSAQLLLPWYVIGQLQPAEHGRVARHIAGCAACQADLALDASIANLATSDAPFSADAGWRRMAARVESDHADEPRPAAAARPNAAPALFADWRGWAIAAQFVLIVLLAVWLAASRTSPPDAYRTLQTVQPAAHGDLLVMFAPETPERSLRATLGDAEARVVDGPTVAGAYVLAVPPGGQQSAIKALRASPGVTLAEPLGPEPRP